MAMFRTGVKILRELSPKKGHCIPIRSISEERHLVLRKPARPTNSIPPQNSTERSVSWVSLSSKRIDESKLNSGLTSLAQTPSTPISAKPKVAGLQHYYYNPQGKTNTHEKIIKDGYITCCDHPYPTSQGPPFGKSLDRRVRRNSKRPPFHRKDIANTAHYKPPYTEYKMSVDTRQPKMQGHFLKIYDVNEITVRSDSATAHPNYTNHPRIGQRPSGKCLRSSKPIPDEVRATKRMEIPTDPSVYSFVNQQGSSFSKIPTLLESHAPYRNISTSHSGKVEAEAQEVKTTQDMKPYVENPVCNMPEFSQEKQINKTNFAQSGRIPSPSYSEMKKAELQNESKSKPIFPFPHFNGMSSDAVLTQRPFGNSGKSLKEICSEGVLKHNLNGNDMKSHEVSNNCQFANPNIPPTDVQCFAEDTKSFGNVATAMGKLNTAEREQNTLKRFEDSINSYDQRMKAETVAQEIKVNASKLNIRSYDQKMKAETVVQEIMANASKVKDSSNVLQSEEVSASGKTRNLKKMQVKRDGLEPTFSQKDSSKHEGNEQKEYSVKERNEPIYQQKGNMKENATQRGIPKNNYDKAEQHNAESYSMNKAYAETVNKNKENMSKENDVEVEDVSTKRSPPQKQNASSFSALEQKSMKTVSKYSKDTLLQKNIPTTNISRFLNIESAYDKQKKFQNPFNEIIADEAAADEIHISRLTETENVVANEKLAKFSKKNTGRFKENDANAESLNKSLNLSHGGSTQRVTKWSPARATGKPSAIPKANFGARNYTSLANNAKLYQDKINGSIQSCSMGTKHPKLGDLSAKDLPLKVPCGAGKAAQEICNAKACKRVCVPGCLIPKQVECTDEPAPPPPCVKVEAPHPSFSECLKCPPLPPYSKMTECHVEKPKGYYKEYKGVEGDACNPPVVVGVCPVRNAFKRVKRHRGEYNVNCDKPPKYPCEVESTFPPSRLDGRGGAAPMKCQSSSSSSPVLNKVSPIQVRFYSTGKLNSPLIKNHVKEADSKIDSQPSTSGVLQSRCIHTPVSLISSTTRKFDPNSIKITGSAQNLSSCEKCGDSKKFGHDIPLRYKYGDFFPTSSYRKTFMPHGNKNKRTNDMPCCHTSTAAKTCSMRKSTGPTTCGGSKSRRHIPYYPSSPYRPTYQCNNGNHNCENTCIKPHKDNSGCSTCQMPKEECSRNAVPCRRPHCPTPAIKRPCSCGPQDVHSKPLQMRCYSGTSFSANDPVLKRHYSDIVAALVPPKMKITPPLLNESSNNLLKFPTLENLKKSVHENELSHASNSLKQGVVFSSEFGGKEIKFPAYMTTDMKCDDEGCDSCRKPRCDRCEKKQCPKPHYKQCPRPPPKRRMCENMPKCPPKPCLKSNRDCHKPCCSDNMCKTAATGNAQVKMASQDKVTVNSTSTLQGLLNSVKNFMSLFISKGSPKDNPTAALKKSGDNVETEPVKVELQPQEGELDVELESNPAGPNHQVPLKSGTYFSGGLFSKPLAEQYNRSLNKTPQENSFLNMNSLKCKTY